MQVDHCKLKALKHCPLSHLIGQSKAKKARDNLSTLQSSSESR